MAESRIPKAADLSEESIPRDAGDRHEFQEPLGLLRGEPVPKAHALGGDSLNPRDAVRQLGRQQSVISGFYGELPHGSDPHVYGNRAQPAGLQRNAPSSNGRLGEARPWLLGVPRKELIEAQVVYAFGDRRRDGIEHQGLEPPPQSAPLSTTANSFI